CERPKLMEYKDLIASELARLLGCDSSRVNLKAKTHERVDAVGEGRAVEAHAVVLLGPKS
ncbi:MAG: 2-C-methyl-D-erythritol 2,4-cyclodiphosphate synthase, partial [Planctomycetota bacterium]|nr:2-C-methyl-D-erythritol 2,4-cyclodiphosphate synthase [Planctomycetota bacterium]